MQKINLVYYYIIYLFNMNKVCKKYKIQKGGAYSIKSIKLSVVDNYLQISQLCVYNRAHENIVCNYEDIIASPHYSEGKLRIGDKYKPIDGNCTSRNFPSIYHSLEKTGEQFWKIIFNVPQTYVDIVYYNRDRENTRMNRGKLELFDDNDRLLLSFDMTEELIQRFSNERINYFLDYGTDNSPEAIIVNKKEEEKRAELLNKESQKLIEKCKFLERIEKDKREREERIKQEERWKVEEERRKVEQEHQKLKEKQNKINSDIKEEEIININIWKNKGGLIWCFDESIDKKTDFEGNTREQSLKEIIILIKHLLLNEKYDVNIDKSILEQFILFLTNNTYLIEYSKARYFDYIFLEEEPLQLFICGWHKHTILLFFEKKENDIYDVGLINCGDGAQFHGIFNELCNGIIIFKDISKINLLNFIKFYKYFYLNHHSNSFNCTIFYSIIFDKLLNLKNEVKDEDKDETKDYFHTIDKEIANESEDKDKKNYEFYIDFTKLIEKGNIEVFKIHLQLIGSCTFTNCINFIYYIYCRVNYINNPVGYNNYMSWYFTSKSYLKNKLLETYKIYNNNISDIYNIIHYINPLEWNKIVIDDKDKKIENNISFKLSSSSPFLANDNISRKKIVDEIGHINRIENTDNLEVMLNYFFDHYFFDNDFKINNYLYKNLQKLYIKPIEHYDVIIKNIMFMKIFYLNNLVIESNIFFLEIYKLYKDNICHFEENIEKYIDHIKTQSDDFLNLTLLFFIYGKNKKIVTWMNYIIV